MDKKGKLIVIEGTDCSGKETQSKILVERLNKEGIACKKMSFPQYESPTGRIVGQCYLGKERGEWEGDRGWFGDANAVNFRVASLYYAADRLFALPKINSILNSGENLVLDRYTPSNMAHQGGKVDLNERKKVFSFIDKLEYNLLELPRPDAVIFLYMPFQVGLQLREKRGEKADLHECNISHLKRAEETYLELSNLYKWIRIDCSPDGTINSLRSIDNIGEEVYKRISEVL